MLFFVLVLAALVRSLLLDLMRKACTYVRVGLRWNQIPCKKSAWYRLQEQLEYVILQIQLTTYPHCRGGPTTQQKLPPLAGDGPGNKGGASLVPADYVPRIQLEEKIQEVLSRDETIQVCVYRVASLLSASMCIWVLMIFDTLFSKFNGELDTIWFAFWLDV